MGVDFRRELRNKIGKDARMKSQLDLKNKIKIFAETMQKSKPSPESSSTQSVSSPSTLSEPVVAQSNTFGDQYDSKRKRFLQGMV